ncbi:MAG: hypothetical protein CMH56_04135 [Myxococcales bacterium]|nr:hypothetical protein [Myxococcales bacterium]
MKPYVAALQIELLTDESQNTPSTDLTALGRRLLEVTPLVELNPPAGIYLNFQGFRASPTTMLQRTLSVLRPHIAFVALIGGTHKEHCMARAHLVMAARQRAPKDWGQTYVAWWSAERMMAQYQTLPLAFLMDDEKDLQFLRDLGLQTWGDVQSINSNKKRKDCLKRLPVWCHHFPEPTSAWRYLSQPSKIEVSKHFDPPLTQETAILFVLRPMVEQLCQRLNDAQKSLVHLQLEAWVRLLPPEDVSACLNDRHRWWSRNFYFNVPVGAADVLYRMVGNACGEVPIKSEIQKMTLRAERTVPLLRHQKDFLGDERTTLKIPLWLEEMQQQFGAGQIGFFGPTYSRAPRESFEISEPDMNSQQRKQMLERLPGFHWPMRWLRHRRLLPVESCWDFEPLGLFQSHPHLLFAPCEQYYRVWLQDHRQVLCEYDSEMDQWWLHAFFD